ncbi:MAG: TetR/AcrR family transcriptional regulator, partial [Spirochaetaceae bacterium]|nr:TetR/AcrR family transcriptional regulator [Spirochaetaceae bacterium]
MTKTDIIITAFRVWGSCLYQTTSLSAIAKTLGVSKAALYRHFKSKQALIEAMHERFFDDFAAFITERCPKPVSEDEGEQFSAMLRIGAEYYVRNREAFIFSLIFLYSNQRLSYMIRSLQERGLDMELFRRAVEAEEHYPPAAQLVMATLTFCVAYFHRYACPGEAAPADEAVRRFIDRVERKVFYGLGIPQVLRETDFEVLESRFAAQAKEEAGLDKDDKKCLLKAIAAVVAEKGPWKASMGMVAERSGLSKSALYFHFKNREDMIQHIFTREFKDLLQYAQGASTLSSRPLARLYLVILATVNYLRIHPEILKALDWMRTRRLGINSKPPEVLQLFQGICLSPTILITEQTAHLILFLIINTLMRCPEGMDFSELPNRSVRILYRFIIQ